MLTVGYTQASSVMPVVRSSDAESLMVTQSLTPSKERALPKRPWVIRVAPLMVPVLPLPEPSTTVEPLASSKL